MFECEKKIMLSADEYIQLIMLMCKYATAEPQTNYYFDDDELSMNEKGITCRIREKGGKYKTTVKNHNTEQPDCSIEIDLLEKEEFDSEIFNALGLQLKGELVTERILMFTNPKYDIVIDKNIYLGHTDYELEVEYCKESEKRVQFCLNNIADCLVATKYLNKIEDFTSRIGKGGSKSERFFERLKNSK